MSDSLPLEISCRETATQMATDNAPLLVDCREADEFDLVAIPGSRLLPMSQITTRLCELAGHEQLPVIVYCHHGARSAQVVMWLRGQGFPSAQSMAGGIDAWAQQIEPGMTRY
ncbi:MAG: rhodanese-like domain-containing protein [Aeoliella sp.]